VSNGKEVFSTTKGEKFLIERGHYKGRVWKLLKQIGPGDDKRGAYPECERFILLVSQQIILIKVLKRWFGVREISFYTIMVKGNSWKD
jgi:hypothetical protein